MKRIFLFLSVIALTAYALRAQEKILSGRITDAEDKTPILGATVAVKGTTVGTVTDSAGNFSLVLPENAKTLVIRSLGKKTMEVDVPEVAELNVELENDILLVDEVLVTALGIKQEKKRIGYSIQEIKGDEINRAESTNLINGIEGKVAGAQVTTSTGTPGASVFIKLRGTNSLTGSNQPLLVVDGVPIDNSMSYSGNPDDGRNNLLESVAYSNRGLDINPDDIESITVLKGANATALYGQSAANGALVITTKRGKATKGEKVSVTVSSGVTFSMVNKLPDLQDKYVQGIDGEWLGPETRLSLSWGPLADTMYWDGDTTYRFDSHGRLVGQNDPAAKEKFVPYDNEDLFFRTGVSAENYFAITGGGDQGTYRLSFSDFREKGVIPLSNWARSTVTLNGDVNISPKVSSAGSITYLHSGGDRVQQGSNLSGLMLDLWRTPISFDNTNGTDDPEDPKAFQFEDGTQRNYRGGVGYDNPFWSINKNPFSDDVNRAYGSLQFNYKPVTWLDIMYRLGGDFYSDRRKQAFDVYSRANPAGQIFEDHQFYRHYNSDLFVTASGKLASNLNGSLLVGWDVFDQNNQQFYTQGDGLTIPGFYNLSNAQSILTREFTYRYRTYSILFDGKLDYKDMLFLNVTGRNDWSSTLPADNNSYFYPSVSLGFVFTELLDLTDSKWFPYGKLRFSFVQAGKDAPLYGLKNYFVNAAYADGWTTGNSFPFEGVSGFTLGDLGGNHELKPEKTNSFEVGTDLRFIENKLGVDFTYYFSKSTDQIFPAPIAASSGLLEVILNAGSIENKGFEITATGTPFKAKKSGDFNWDIVLNWSKNKNKVLELAEGIESLILGGFEGSDIRAVAGQPYGTIYGGRWLRDANGNVVIDDDTLSGNYGYPIVDEQTGVIGNPNPKWLMGITNTWSYKGFTLYFLIDIRHGGDIWNGTKGALTFFGRSKLTENRGALTVFEGVKGHYDEGGNLVTSGPNDIKVPLDQDWYTGNGGGFGSQAEDFIEDGSYVRFRELALSYSLPKKTLGKSFFKDVTFTFFSRNLALFTDYTGVDPETSLMGAHNSQGLDYFNNPGTRSFGFKVNLGF